MDYIKCKECGNYDEPLGGNLRIMSYTPDLCSDYTEEEQRQLRYDAFECGYGSVEEYLNSKALFLKEVKL